MAEKLFNVGIKSIIKNDDKVLVLKNTKGFWEVPGGRIDSDETIEQALMRELKEELPNISSIKIDRILASSRLQKDIKPNVSLVLVFYLVSAKFDGDPKLSHEHIDFLWADKDEALSMVYESCVEAIEQAYKV